MTDRAAAMATRRAAPARRHCVARCILLALSWWTLMQRHSSRTAESAAASTL
ncbi:hypothetical protein ACIF6L_36960 [Kitasatospora sp. NPDC086009]|uniref:hypothetical protein n=1 Tax=unclassified Kitasatospora TaxID=2633591 RepID=UPI0037CB6992